MGGSNIPQAFPNYFICLRFIRISTVGTFMLAHYKLPLIFRLTDGCYIVVGYTGLSHHRYFNSMCSIVAHLDNLSLLPCPWRCSAHDKECCLLPANNIAMYNVLAWSSRYLQETFCSTYKPHS